MGKGRLMFRTEKAVGLM